MAAGLVVIGNFLVDDVVLPDGTTRMGEAGGATLYTALGAAIWGTPCAVVTYRGEDYPAWALDALASHGVDLSGVHDLGGPGLRTWLLYEGRRRRLVHRLGCPTHEAASPGPERIPSALLSARAFHLAPMPFEVQRALASSLAALPGALLSLDPHLPVEPGTRASWHDVLCGIDVLFAGEDELPGIAEDPRPVLRDLAQGRLGLVICKRGPRGGIAYDRTTARFLEWGARAERVVDPTGAGDAFAGGLLAGRLAGDSLHRALQRAVVSASFAVEEWGAAGLTAATPQRARDRLAAWSGT